MNRLILALVVILGIPAATIAYIYLIELLVARLPDRVRYRLRPWLWVGPAVFLVAVYLVYPSINTAYRSLLNNNSTRFVGLENFRFALTDPQMLAAFRNNLIWLIFFTAFTVIIGLLIAILADRVGYESLVKAIIFLPMAISYVAASVIWRLMYEYQPPGRPQTGTVNALLTALFPNFEPLAWLVNYPINNLALIAIGVWMWTGFSTVIFSAGLKSIPEEILEAARIDGANEFQILRNVTVPMLSSTIAVVTTTMIINVLKIFDIIYVMTNGNFNTEVIANRMYKEMFNFRHFGRASAIAMVLFLAIVPVMIANIRRFREQEALR
jgi:alpha-glucoside transport system permease protein